MTIHALLLAAAVSGQAAANGQALLEIRSYNLVPGERVRFHRLFVNESLPLLERARIDVVAYGPSLHDEDSYFLMRAFASLEAREQQEAAFYGSEEWRRGPRDAVLAAIQSYTTVIVAVDRDTLTRLRRTGGAMSTETTATDLEMLTRLNDDYINAVQTSNVARFRELLSDDFQATLSDGSLLDREQFLELTAKPSTIRDLAAHEVNVRLMGDFAIVHARTSFTLADGSPGSGRYTDVWARRDGRWVAVAAHVTRK